MAMPPQYHQVIHPPTQNAMGGANLHTPPSIFQHMMGQQNSHHQSGQWPQMPQVPPMTMPWSIPNLQQTQLVRFTGERLQLTNFGKPLHVKRKMDVPDLAETNHRTKQFITEEKMAAHFQDMHISNNYSENPRPSTSGMSEPQPSCSSVNNDGCIDLNIDSETTIMENGKSIHPRLVISEELKRLQQEPLLPGRLLSKLERPSMALVLWEPPSKHLRMLSTRRNIHDFSRSFNNHNNNNNNNNNNSDDDSNTDNSMISDGTTNNNHEDIPDMNQAIMEEPSNLELEPMDV